MRVRVLMLLLCGTISASAARAVSAQAKTEASDAGATSSGRLETAANILRGISTDSLKSDARKQIALLREHFDELQRAYAANGTPFIPPASDESDQAANHPPNWKEHFSDVEGDLAKLIGGGSTLGNQVLGATAVVGIQPTPSSPQAPDPGPTGGASTVQSSAIAANSAGGVTPATPATPDSGAAMLPGSPVISGVAVSAIGLKNLDPAVRHQLETFRLDLELFFASTMMGRDTVFAQE